MDQVVSLFRFLERQDTRGLGDRDQCPMTQPQ